MINDIFNDQIIFTDALNITNVAAGKCWANFIHFVLPGGFSKINNLNLLLDDILH